MPEGLAQELDDAAPQMNGITPHLSSSFLLDPARVPNEAGDVASADSKLDFVDIACTP